MMAMSTWADVVTTALLGTDRRPVPSDLPVGWAGLEPSKEPARRVLDLAASHRAWVRAGVGLQVADPPPVAPSEEGVTAPAAAQELLGQLLQLSNPTMINYWLAACVDRGLLVSAEHWHTLAAMAAASAGYDRLLLGRALGARGLWFLRQNPAWERLAAQITAALSESVPSQQNRPMESERAAAFSEVDAAFAVIQFHPEEGGSLVP